MKMIKIGLLPRVCAAIAAGLLLGGLLPTPIVRAFVTFNELFANMLGFCIPLIVLGLVVPSIADLGKNAGRLLLVTVLISYSSTLFSGLFTYFSSATVFPALLGGGWDTQPPMPDTGAGQPLPYFGIAMPPAFGVMTGLLLAFVLGIGIASGRGGALKAAFAEFKEIIEKLIAKLIIPLLPLHILGIFLGMAHSGTAFHVIEVFGKVIGVIFVLHIVLLLVQFSIAGAVARRNPLALLRNMLPAYLTALGTASSAATIPVTLAQTKRNGVSPAVADFCVPLCATIHLAGSTMKVVAMALAICIVKGMPCDPGLFIGFIALLGVMMIAAPGVPGGAIMAATGVLQTTLQFDAESVGMMIALYVAIDSFGTACNVTGDGAIAVVVDKLAR